MKAMLISLNKLKRPIIEFDNRLELAIRPDARDNDGVVRWEIT